MGELVILPGPLAGLRGGKRDRERSGRAGEGRKNVSVVFSQ